LPVACLLLACCLPACLLLACCLPAACLLLACLPANFHTLCLFILFYVFLTDTTATPYSGQPATEGKPADVPAASKTEPFSTILIIVIVLATLLVIMICVFVIFCCQRKRKSGKPYTKEMKYKKKLKQIISNYSGLKNNKTENMIRKGIFSVSI